MTHALRVRTRHHLNNRIIQAKHKHKMGRKWETYTLPSKIYIRISGFCGVGKTRPTHESNDVITV